jgi:hypothetical protein
VLCVGGNYFLRVRVQGVVRVSEWEGDGGRMVFRCRFVSFWQGELSLAAHIASLLAEHSQVHGMRHGNQ